jgi:hypothetical protein
MCVCILILAIIALLALVKQFVASRNFDIWSMALLPEEGGILA